MRKSLAIAIVRFWCAKPEIEKKKTAEKSIFILTSPENLYLTVSNATLARHHLSFWSFFFQFYFRWGVQLQTKNAFTKAASRPAGRQSENAGPRPFGLIFRCCPHLEFFSSFSSSELKRHLLKRHLTLSENRDKNLTIIGKMAWKLIFRPFLQ